MAKSWVGTIDMYLKDDFPPKYNFSFELYLKNIQNLTERKVLSPIYGDEGYMGQLGGSKYAKRSSLEGDRFPHYFRLTLPRLFHNCF